MVGPLLPVEKGRWPFPTKGNVRKNSGEFCEIHPNFPCRHAARAARRHTCVTKGIFSDVHAAGKNAQVEFFDKLYGPDTWPARLTIYEKSIFKRRTGRRPRRPIELQISFPTTCRGRLSWRPAILIRGGAATFLGGRNRNSFGGPAGCPARTENFYAGGSEKIWGRCCV